MCSLEGRSPPRLDELLDFVLELRHADRDALQVADGLRVYHPDLTPQRLETDTASVVDEPDHSPPRVHAVQALCLLEQRLGLAREAARKEAP